MPAFPDAARGLYAILDPSLCAGRDPVRVAEAILEGGCAVLQLRSKTMEGRAVYALAVALRERARAAGVPFVVNDRLDVALACGADGVHVGQEDLPADVARRLAPALVLGVSTHSPTQARDAARAGADLIGFGPVFATMSKERPDPVVGTEALAAVVRESPIPVVAIGGVTLSRARDVANTGARFGAAISAICAADDPAGAARAMHAALRGET